MPRCSTRFMDLPKGKKRPVTGGGFSSMMASFGGRSAGITAGPGLDPTEKERRPAAPSRSAWRTLVKSSLGGILRLGLHQPVSKPHPAGSARSGFPHTSPRPELINPLIINEHRMPCDTRLFPVGELPVRGPRPGSRGPVPDDQGFRHQRGNASRPPASPGCLQNEVAGLPESGRAPDVR